MIEIDKIDLIRTLLSIILFMSAVTKWVGMQTFYKTLYNLKVPPKLIVFSGWLIPTIELAVGIGFLFKQTVLWSELAFPFLLIAFVWAIRSGQKAGLRCNCFGNMLQEKFGLISYVRVLILLLLNIVLIFSTEHHEKNIPFVIHDLLIAFLISIGLLLLLNLLHLQLEYKKRKISEM